MRTQPPCQCMRLYPDYAEIHIASSAGSGARLCIYQRHKGNIRIRIMFGKAGRGGGESEYVFSVGENKPWLCQITGATRQDHGVKRYICEAFSLKTALEPQRAQRFTEVM